MEKRCNKCGTIYDDLLCPVCSVERKLEKKIATKEPKKTSEEKWWEEYQRDFKKYQEREREKQQEKQQREAALEERQKETDYALEEQRRIQAEAWRLQADSKADKAYELYKAGLYEEAIKICLETISHQDPGNIKLYRFAAWSFEKLGHDTKVRELLKKQISLLKASDYRCSEREALRVLQDILGLDKKEDLMQSFEDVTREFKYIPSDLLDELIKYSFYDNAQKLYLNTVEYSETLLDQAYGIELNNKVLKKQDTDRLARYLQGIPYTQRNNVFEAFNNINSSAIFAEETIRLIRKEIRKRYDEWAPEIKRELEERAVKQAKEEAARKSGPAVIGWIIAIIILIILWGHIGWFKSLLLAIITGIFISRITRSIIRGNIEAKSISSLRGKEQDTLNSALVATDLLPGVLEEIYKKRAGMNIKTKMILFAIFLLVILALFTPRLVKEKLGTSEDIYQTESPQQKEIAKPVPLYRETQEAIAGQKKTITPSIPLLNLDEAKQRIPNILERIYNDLDQGNPKASSSFLSSEILSNFRLLDTICKPFIYRAHYVEYIIERPENKFEVRIRVLLKPMEEGAQVLTFRAKDDSLVLENISSYLEVWFSTWKEEAIEASRNFYYALKADKQDFIDKLVSSPDVLHLEFTSSFSRILQPKNYNEFKRKIQSLGAINSISAQIISYKGIKALVHFSCESDSFTGITWDIYVDNIDGELKIVKWQYKEWTWEACGSDPNIELYTLNRFKSRRELNTSQVEATVPENEIQESKENRLIVLNEKEKLEQKEKNRILEEIERKKVEEEQKIKKDEEKEEKKPVRAIGEIKPPKLVKKVETIYPEIAAKAKIEGVVILEVTTDIYGRVKNIKVLRSIPLLDQAAIDAVRQWVYEPVLINGKPSGVIFTATIFFKLPS